MITDSSGALYHAWLASAALPPETVQALLDASGTPEQVFRAVTEGRIGRRPKGPERRSGTEGSQETEDEETNATADVRLPAAGLQALRQNAAEERLKKTEETLQRHGIRAFTTADPEYPEELLEMPDPPAMLFYQGDLRCLRGRKLAMVGSRAASYDGQRAAGKIARELSRNGIEIVSGMAGGIDSASHSGCLEGGSPTIAVTGCGLDRVYPAVNTRLRDRILENGGLLLSEYAPGERPEGWHFPFRNRIITGLARALIVMEAKIRSGTMTSVRHALDQGKDVFVYPGDPASPNYEGNHHLLREGAIYFTTAGNILEDLGWLDNPGIIRQNSECSGGATESSSPEEAAVIKALTPGKLSFEQITEKSGLAPAALMSTLTMLQIRGKVEALPGKIYRLV